ncbi:MAG: hypothetical protein VX252_13385 [Myxococcota bacterium]|nr:hypothetical protein [Myxococcota bacterium]
MSRRNIEIEFWLWTGLGIAVLVGLQWGPLLACPGQCYVDTELLHGRSVGFLEAIDTRLNTWILAWTQNALLSPGPGFFDGSMLYPAPGALAGSEHLIGPALLTLPVRLFSGNAVLNYSAAILLSSLILGFSTAALARWASGSRLLGFLAAAITLSLPWRLAEISHLQLLSVGFIPLIVLLTLRIMLGEARRFTAPALFVALTLQLLTSYYLAYQVTLCLGIVLGVGLLWIRPALSRLMPLAAALGLSYLALLLVSIPYLTRNAQGELRVTFNPEEIQAGDHLTNAFQMLWPRFNTLWQQNPGPEPAYYIPATVLILALISLFWFMVGTQYRQVHQVNQIARARLTTLILWLSCVAAFCMMPGSHAVVGEEIYRLPAYWAAQLIPGFIHLRAPHRWAIVIATAMPILAVLGIQVMVRLLGDRAVGDRLPLRVLASLAVAGLIFLNLPVEKIAIQPAYEGSASHTRLYRELASRPFGPVLELPWHLDALQRNKADTRYMLSSTVHGRPLLNGFTAHLPPSYFLLNRISQDLPARRAIDSLSQLTDLRWIVVHWNDLSDEDRKVWQEMDSPDLELVYSDEEGALFELAPLAQTGQWMPSLLETQTRPYTLSGLSRAPLTDRGKQGMLLSAQLAGRFRFLGAHPIPKPLSLRVANTTSRTWPGLDVQPEGLVALRYSFSDLEDHVVADGIAPLDADIVPGLSDLAPVLNGPTHDGTFRLCLELIQQIGDETRPLAVPPLEIEVETSGLGVNRDESINRWRKYQENQLKPETTALSRCARDRRAAEPEPPI